MTLTFKGYTWNISERVGGPNNNTFKANNVSIDSNGNLSLKITKQSDVWTAAEVALNTSLGYGDYTFMLASPIKYEKNVVAAGFTYLDDNNEIDWEASYWGGAINNLGYTVQPAPYTSANNVDFVVAEGIPGYKVTIHFYPQDISIKTQDANGVILKDWKYTGTYQPSSSQIFMFNLWLQGDKTLINPTSFVISDFAFKPVTDLSTVTNQLIKELDSQNKLSAIKTEAYSSNTASIKINNIKKII